MSDSDEETISNQESIPISRHSFSSSTDDSTTSHLTPLNVGRTSNTLAFNPIPASHPVEVNIRVKGGKVHDEGITYTLPLNRSLNSLWRAYAAACNINHWDIYLCTSRGSLERNGTLLDNDLQTGDIILAYDRGRRGVAADLLSESMDFCLLCVRTSSVLNGLHLGRHFRCKKTKRIERLLMEWGRANSVDPTTFTFSVAGRIIDISGTLEAQQIVDGDVIVATLREA